MPERKERPITSKERAFIDLIVEGKLTEAECWKKAYNKPEATYETAKGNANQVKNRPKIQKEIERRLKIQQARFSMKKEDVAKEVLNIFQNWKELKPDVGLNALKEINKMYGYHAPTKQINAEVSLSDVLNEFKDDETDQPIQNS